MSTILDALKKSEQERKLNDIPTLSDIPAPEEVSRFSRTWLISSFVLIGLLVLILALLLSDRFVSATSNNVDIAAREQQQSLPVDGGDIAINVISWSEDDAQRFVLIDGTLARESEFAAPGLKVMEIRRDSVIVNYRGKEMELRP